MDVESSFKSFADGLGGGAFGKLFKNPVYVAIIITAVIMLIVICIFDDEHTIKTTFYVLLASSAIIFLHNKLLLVDYKKRLCSRDEENIAAVASAGPSTYVGASEISSERLSYLNDM